MICPSLESANIIIVKQIFLAFILSNNFSNLSALVNNIQLFIGVLAAFASAFLTKTKKIIIFENFPNVN